MSEKKKVSQGPLTVGLSSPGQPGAVFWYPVGKPETRQPGRRTVVFGNDEVAHYYDVNTRSFLRFGQGGAMGVLHRAVWGPGVTNRTQAFHYVHDLLLEQLAELGSELPTHEPLRVLDLGCGVGATLAYLAERAAVSGLGITNSRVQVRLARDPSRGHLRFVEGDFCHLLRGPHRGDTNKWRSGKEGLGAASFHLAYAVESFVQASDPGAFFMGVADLLVDRGRLVICDDFLSQEKAVRSVEEKRWLQEFRRGWQARSLMSTAQTDELARDSGLGLLGDLDLSAQVETGRPRDWMIRMLVAAGRTLGLSRPRWLSLLGGNALQQCLKTGLVEYRFRTWRRKPRLLDHGPPMTKPGAA